MTYLLLTGVALLFVYEIWAAVNARKGDTISEIIWQASRRAIVPFAFGVLCGHLFW